MSQVTGVCGLNLFVMGAVATLSMDDLLGRRLTIIAVHFITILLACFCVAFHADYLRLYVPKRKVVLVDMDGVLFGEPSAEWIKQTPEKGHWSDVPGVFHDLPVMPGAVDALKWLMDHFEVFVVSTPVWTQPSSWSDKRISLHRAFGDAVNRKLVLTHDKSLVQCDFCIDDRRTHGTEKMGNKLIQFGQPGLEDWPSVVERMKKEI